MTRLVPILAVAWLGCQAQAQRPSQAPSAPRGSPAWKVANAESAAPRGVSAAATILDWPAAENAAPATLRVGSNGWVCYPDMPDTPPNDPMCLDGEWTRFFEAYLGHKPFTSRGVGLSYMLQEDWTASNTDPYQAQPSAGQDWIKTGPHLMILVPDARVLDALTTDPSSGRPYVMWKGTPYAHIMAPLQ